MPQVNKNNIETKTLESWLWEAACKIRGSMDAPKFKDYTFPISLAWEAFGEKNGASSFQEMRSLIFLRETCSQIPKKNLIMVSTTTHCMGKR